MLGGCASAPQPHKVPNTSEARQGLGKDKQQQAFDLGYVRGQADQTKRHYWMLQALHRSESDQGGQLRYYSFPAHEQTEDGRKLVPHTVTIPIVE
jgi:hypothetical protein